MSEEVKHEGWSRIALSASDRACYDYPDEDQADLRAAFVAGALYAHPSPEVELVACDRCQGNGEIVTDWNRYLHARTGDVGDEAVAECPDCNGEGQISSALSETRSDG